MGEKSSSQNPSSQIHARSKQFWMEKTIARGGVGTFRRFQIHVALKAREERCLSSENAHT